MNGVEVIEISTEHRNGKSEKALYMLSDMGTGYENTIFNEHIKSIVTKEQFAQAEYKIEKV